MALRSLGKACVVVGVHKMGIPFGHTPIEKKTLTPPTLMSSPNCSVHWFFSGKFKGELLGGKA